MKDCNIYRVACNPVVENGNYESWQMEINYQDPVSEETGTQYIHFNLDEEGRFSINCNNKELSKALLNQLANLIN